MPSAYESNPGSSMMLLFPEFLQGLRPLRHMQLSVYVLTTHTFLTGVEGLWLCPIDFQAQGNFFFYACLLRSLPSCRILISRVT